MASGRIKGDESWQELRDRATTKFNEARARRGDDGTRGRGGANPISTTDVVLIGEANFLISLAELERARG
jgi:hypothetical protein